MRQRSCHIIVLIVEVSIIITLLVYYTFISKAHLHTPPYTHNIHCIDSREVPICIDCSSSKKRLITMKLFSKDAKDRVVLHLFEDQSLRKVASLLGMSHTTGHRIGLRRRLDLERKRGGKLRRLFERNECEIVRLI